MNFLSNAVSGIVNEAAKAVGLDDELDEVKDVIEDKTGMDADALMSGDLVGGVMGLLDQQDEILQDKFGSSNVSQNMDFKIYLTREDTFNISCPLLDIKQTDNILLKTFYELFFSSNPSDKSYKIRSEICRLLFSFRFVYSAYTGFLVSPAYALEASSKGARDLLFHINGMFQDLINFRPINDTLIMSLRSELITGFINNFYFYILILLSVLSGKNTYKLIKG